MDTEDERDEDSQEVASDAGNDSSPVPNGPGADAGDPVPSAEGYDALVLQDEPVAYWAIDQMGESEPDLSGNDHEGEYQGPERDFGMLPNADPVAIFNGEDNYLSVESSADFSIPTTGNLTWEGWIQPEVLQFPNDSGGYVNWMGKCADYSPSCEWEARMYNTENGEGRCNRISAYVFNPSAGLGSAADWQPECGLIEAGNWYHVVGEYTLDDAPDDCDNTAQYPGSIEIWVNGVKWDHSSHGDTGCMSQYDVVPEAGDSPFNVGTMAHDTWFQGAIGKVAIYDYLLPEERIHAHYTAMTGLEVTGSCGDDCTF